MEIDEWRALARAEAATTLHEFNFEREEAFKSAQLEAAHAAFAAYLEGIVLTGSSSASGILRDYLQSIVKQIESHPAPAAGGVMDWRYSPPELRRDSAQVFLRSAGAHAELMHWLGILESDYWDAHDDIRSTLADPGFDGDIDDAMELQLQAFADSIATVLPIDRHHAAPIASAADRLRRSPVDPKRSNDPWWFTYEDELHRENEQLPDPSNPLQKSGYVAGLRASLGLKHDSEQLDDHEAAGPGIVARRTIAAISFRIYIQFSMHIAEGDKDSLYQPSLFSGGYPHLFLSEPRKSAGGRTVRLKDKLCACPPDCLCAREGLPEGIIPEQIVLATREHRVRGVYLGLHRDLSRYSVPPCDEIRRRCALAA